MSKPRDLSRLFTNDTTIATDVELINISTAASANALTQANNYTDSEINTIDLTSTINTASAAAYASASAYTDSAIASFEALPSQSGNDGKYLSTDGSTTSWETLDLDAAINTASAAAYSSASAYTDSAIGSFEALPSQSGNAGKYLSTDGSITSWATLDLNSAINTASAAAYASASAYTDSQISSIDLSATIQTASAAAVTYLVDSAPSTLDTLNELAAALGDDANYATTITNALGNKLDSSTASTTYLTQSSASTLYLTQSSASSTYATKAEAQNSLTRWSKIYSASATVISGVDDNVNNLNYTVGFTTLFINGILQDPTNYTATSGSAIVLSDPVLTNDVVEVLSYKTFNVANTYTTSEIDSKVSNYTRWVKTLSGSATVISGVDDNSLPLSYTIGNEEVYVNGILLKEVTDYAATSASVINLTEAALSGDTVEVINFTTINLASVYTKNESDSRFEPNIAYVSSSPSVPTAGTLWIDSTNSAAPALKVYNGSTWIAVSGSSEAGLHPFFQAGI